MSKNLYMNNIGRKAKIASSSLQNIDAKTKNAVLKQFSIYLKKYSKSILKANKKDILSSKKNKNNRDERLELNYKKITQIIKSVKDIIKIKHGFSGTHMYGISLTAAEEAVKNLYPIRAAADGYLNRFLIQKKYDSVKLKNCYASVENLGFNDSIDGKTNSYIDEIS